LPAARGENAVGGALGATTFPGAGDGFDQAGAQKTVDGVVEGAAFEDQDFVLVAFVKEGLHLVGMHGLFAQEGEDGDFPDTKVVGHGCHR